MNSFELQFIVLQQRIFRLICKRAGMKLNQSEIAKELRATPAGIAKALPLLEKNNLHVTQTGWFLSANFSFVVFQLSALTVLVGMALGK